MYLSMVKLDFRCVNVARSLWNEQDMHRNVLALFDSNREDGHILYRYIPSVDIDRSVLCVQSDMPPKSVDGLNVVSSVNVDERNAKLHVGVCVRFDVLLRPMWGHKGKHSVIRTQDERLEWVKNQGVKNGFEIEKINEISGIRKSMKHDTHSQTIGVNGYRYAGILRVIDVDKFMHVYTCGLGRGKAYGYGMLMLR